VLPDELEKHCIQAERNLDKNGSASKKLASAHLPLWICRRFSTDALVLQVLELPNLSVCIQVGCSVGSFSKQQSRIVGRTSIVGKTPAFFLHRSRLFHFLPVDKKTLAQCWPGIGQIRRLRLRFSTLSRFSVLVNLNRHINW
jgi:hypothetical protein